VGNEAVLFCHESAFRDQAMVLRDLRRKFAALKAGPLQVIEVSAREVPLSMAVATYLFNSQLISLPEGRLCLLAATECEAEPRTRKYLASLSERTGIAVEFADLRQSMRNGGGPACLRLRAVLTEEEWADVPAGVKFTESLYGRLRSWIGTRYRDRLLPADLSQPELLDESRITARGIYEILGFTLESMD
jgi:succinylarginine dihydrolase